MARAAVDEQKRQEPEIRPLRPDAQPQPSVPEIPDDKDAPEKQSPTQGGN